MVPVRRFGDKPTLDAATSTRQSACMSKVGRNEPCPCRGGKKRSGNYATFFMTFRASTPTRGSSPHFAPTNLRMTRASTLLIRRSTERLAARRVICPNDGYPLSHRAACPPDSPAKTTTLRTKAVWTALFGPLNEGP